MEGKSIIIYPKYVYEELPEGTRFTVEEDQVMDHTGDGGCFYGNHYRVASQGCDNCGMKTVYILEPME